MSYSILVIEDDLDIQELIQEFLLSQAYDVTVASDGLEGIRIFKEKPVDLVILDVMLPQLDGHSVCKMIRDQSNVPIIMLTALGEETDQLKGFELGVDDYVSKPFSFNVLIKRVEAVLRRTHRTEPSQRLSYNGLVLDTEGHTVTVGSKKPDLTAKEFDILHALLRNRGKVLSRDMLLNQVWGIDFYGDPRVVDTHIKNLRKKLGSSYIQTVKGIGYKIGD
ncbi:transcriptional regulator [Thermoactinomyces vulgaris]|jgi:two-component system, OmpR family, response regulator VanR|uniref:response regulator transcription factor n=1 Tax=Laceyella sacchari TaxID=37482 RepID=UPI0003B2EB4C|nr:response regulator transcription factor [Laceyella sacchari]KPC76759.1 transcriptional regulator [Thermoactinomyces vulgaris]TCW39389.1 two-component system response regulator VanR [Laceyella sacchari]